MKSHIVKSILHLLMGLSILSSCSPKPSSEEIIPIEPQVPSASVNIKNRGNVLVAVTSSNTASYFIYKGRTLGYDYEMLHKLADHLNLELAIRLESNEDSMLQMLNSGEVDLIAYANNVTFKKKENCDFTERIYHTSQCLIQKKPSQWQELRLHQINNRLIRNVLDINDAPIHVIKNSKQHKRLLQLSNEIGDSLTIITVDSITDQFELMKMVSSGDIMYTVADEDIAGLFSAYDNEIDYNTYISMPEQKAWSVRKNSPQLLESINAWLKNYKRYKEFYFIYDKYFNNPATYKKISTSEFSSSTGKLSPYDDILKKESVKIGWDWRLLAALVYQESRFQPNEVSNRGAIGLMQVMPTTANMHGFKNMNHSETNIKAGVKHLEYINKLFLDIDSLDRIKFTLAAYNVGVGHIYDAQRLATYLELDSNIWDKNVAEALLLKSKKEYYSLPECRNGYCKGAEPYKYVKEILERYENYAKLFEE